MIKKTILPVLVLVLVFSMVLPVLAAEDLVLDITSVAKREMVSKGFEWFVKPGTYHNF